MTIYRCSLLGTLPGGEVWQLGLHTSDGGAGSLGDMLDTWSGAMTDLWSGNGTTVDGIGSVIASNVSTVSIRVASLSSVDGKQTDALEDGLVLPGTSASPTSLPQEVAVVCTTRGAATNRRNRGRFFMPPLAVDTVLDTGLLDPLTQVILADSCHLALVSLDGDGKPAVIWHRDLLTFTAITRMDIGNVFDAQRRRRNKIVEVREGRTI